MKTICSLGVKRECDQRVDSLTLNAEDESVSVVSSSSQHAVSTRCCVAVLVQQNRPGGAGRGARGAGDADSADYSADQTADTNCPVFLFTTYYSLRDVRHRQH